MKNSKQQSAIWPYLGILAFLFVLSLTAPRAWERKSRWELAHIAVPDPSVAIAIPNEPDDATELAPPEVDVEPPTAEEPSLLLDPPTLDPVVPPAPEFADEVPDAATVPDAPAGPAPDENPLAEQPAPPTIDESAPAKTGWPLPRVLLEQLSGLSQEHPELAWPERATGLVHELCQNEAGRTAMRKTLDSLRRLGTDTAGASSDDASPDPAILRTRYALTRWLDVWEAAIALEEKPIDEQLGRGSAENVAQCLADFEQLAKNRPEGAAWRGFLKLEALKSAVLDGHSDLERRTAARAVLDRLASSRLSRAQRNFANEGPLANLREQLLPWAAEEVTAARLLSHLEQYEYSGLASDARLVADDYRGLKWSAPDEAEQLSRRLNTHYRNANVRVAVSGDLINRMVPQPDRIDAPVRDTVVNVPVRGHSSTFTRLTIKLIPDPRRIRLGLEARGTVASNTVASSGPATFWNKGQSTFLVRKLFVLGPHGLNVWPAIAEAENNYNALVSLETNFDGVPLVGSLVRSIARSQHDDARDEARREAAEKVAIRALRQLDTETQDRLLELGQNLERKQLATLERMGLDLTPISLSTDEERAMARAMLASQEQLGAFTPRPRAPADSWFSLQVHQSALNNALEQLDLDGRTFELPELFDWVSKKLGRPELAKLDELPENVRLKFADTDAVRLRCQGGRVEVTFAFSELTHDGSRWRDFQVRTYYVPQANGLDPRFVRDDTIHLDGRSLKGKLQLKLRAIFSRVLSKNRDLRLLDESVTSDSRIKDLQITQFDVQDGWIALAYAARRASNKVARQPK